MSMRSTRDRQPSDRSQVCQVLPTAKGVSLGQRCVAAAASQSHGDVLAVDADHDCVARVFHAAVAARGAGQAPYGSAIRAAEADRRCSSTRSRWIGRRSRRRRRSWPRFTKIWRPPSSVTTKSKAADSDADSKDVKKAENEVHRMENEVNSVLYRPYREAGFPDIGPVSRWMMRMRARIFGGWTIGSIAGRDEFGRDVLSRVFWGARISIIVGIVATLVSLIIGVTYGAISGYVGGWVDDVMMRFVDILYSLPFIFIVIFLISILSEETLKARLAAWGIDRITIFYLVVGAIYWLTMARVVRGQVISLRNELFVESARSVGASQTRIIVKHILPNLLSVVIVYLTLTIPRVMLFEAFLSFLGLGVEPPDVSWGLLANEGIKVITPIKIYWWLIVFPSLALGITLYALNFLGDGLRDALDPKLTAAK